MPATDATQEGLPFRALLPGIGAPGMETAARRQANGARQLSRDCGFCASKPRIERGLSPQKDVRIGMCRVLEQRFGVR